MARRSGEGKGTGPGSTPIWIHSQTVREPLKTEAQLVSEWTDIFCATVEEHLPLALRKEQSKPRLVDGHCHPDTILQRFFFGDNEQLQTSCHKAVRITLDSLLQHQPEFRECIINGEIDPTETAIELAPQLAKILGK